MEQHCWETTWNKKLVGNVASYFWNRYSQGACTKSKRKGWKGLSNNLQLFFHLFDEKIG
jgi:hypothetical protein